MDELVRRAELIFVGLVDQIGQPPFAWSGVGKALQSVTYRVERVLKGSFTDPTIEVLHVVLEGAADANPDPQRPGLDENLVAPANRLIVFASFELDPADHDQQRRRWEDVGDGEGVKAHTQALEDQIRQLV
jgi:hypothetical protein